MQQELYYRRFTPDRTAGVLLTLGAILLFLPSQLRIAQDTSSLGDIAGNARNIQIAVIAAIGLLGGGLTIAGLTSNRLWSGVPGILGLVEVYSHGGDVALAAGPGVADGGYLLLALGAFLMFGSIFIGR